MECSATSRRTCSRSRSQRTFTGPWLSHKTSPQSSQVKPERTCDYAPTVVANPCGAGVCSTPVPVSSTTRSARSSAILPPDARVTAATMKSAISWGRIRRFPDDAHGTRVVDHHPSRVARLRKAIGGEHDNIVWRKRFRRRAEFVFDAQTNERPGNGQLSYVVTAAHIHGRVPGARILQRRLRGIEHASEETDKRRVITDRSKEGSIELFQDVRGIVMLSHQRAERILDERRVNRSVKTLAADVRNDQQATMIVNAVNVEEVARQWQDGAPRKRRRCRLRYMDTNPNR